jgi:hypothetical protein
LIDARLKNIFYPVNACFALLCFAAAFNPSFTDEAGMEQATFSLQSTICLMN